MNKKQQRLAIIRKTILDNQIASQEELLQILSTNGLVLTQATLSRYLKQMKVVKMPNISGDYVYFFSEDLKEKGDRTNNEGIIIPVAGFLSIEFANNLAIIKTLPGSAGSIAYHIDQKVKAEILGTIAGDDTVLIIPREGFSKKQIIHALATLFPNIH